MKKPSRPEPAKAYYAGRTRETERPAVPLRLRPPDRAVRVGPTACRGFRSDPLLLPLDAGNGKTYAGEKISFRSFGSGRIPLPLYAAAKEPPFRNVRAVIGFQPGANPLSRLSVKRFRTPTCFRHSLSILFSPIV